MLDAMAPARRRLFLVVGGMVVLAVVATAVLLVLRSQRGGVTPVAQDEQGPVLLVPGYGGDTSSLDVLAQALRRTGREVVLVDAPGDGTGDLDAQAEHLASVAATTMRDAGAGSVDVVGYSAGGVVVRLWVADHGGGDVVRRAVTLASPHHGTDLAGLAGDLAPDSCPEACQQLATGSDLVRALNAGDETPPGPRWVALWTTDDKTVVPPSSGALEGATSFSLQSVCPDLTVSHADVPRTPAVIAIVERELGTAAPTVPDSTVCR
ncbi:alpha/beta fold hydrolase [Nocardioides sp. KIGAM211]|uniref:Alpha/beta fold hydrolase n=1 Tax=Nocardioides luti TaxID=2761101 RepID=A0A7X0V995_9ACTN|nr:alpha/beta fold hydrolase [Nocardioides luti]